MRGVGISNENEIVVMKSVSMKYWYQCNETNVMMKQLMRSNARKKWPNGQSVVVIINGVMTKPEENDIDEVTMTNGNDSRNDGNKWNWRK